MMRLRDDTAERLIILYRLAQKAKRLEMEGKTTRAGRLRTNNRIIEETLRALLNMQQAGAPVDLDALDFDPERGGG